MSPIVRTVRDLRTALTPVAAASLIVTACALAFVSPERVDLIGLFLATGSALLADPGRAGARSTDRGE